VLYLLLVNCTALLFITNAKPYINPKDNFLSTFLTCIECSAFLIALLIISGISEAEGYDKTALFNTLLAMIFVGLCAVAPYTFMMKIEYFRESISRCLGNPSLLVQEFNLSRWSAAARMQGDMQDLRESVVELERQSVASSSSAPVNGGASLELTELYGSSLGGGGKEVKCEGVAPVRGVISPLHKQQGHI
jgi:hypothetical protein